MQQAIIEKAEPGYLKLNDEEIERVKVLYPEHLIPGANGKHVGQRSKAKVVSDGTGKMMEIVREHSFEIVYMLMQSVVLLPFLLV